MKRPPKTFVVEHKRRTRTVATTPSIWTGSTGREMQSLLQTSIADDAAPDLADRKAPAARSAPGRAQDGPKRRILEARAEAVVPSEPTEPEPVLVAEQPPRRRGRPRKVVVPALSVETVLEPEPAYEPALDMEAAAPEPSMDCPLAPKAPRTRPTFAQKRREARSKLPLGERWKWNFKY